jgi:hypothetical protein
LAIVQLPFKLDKMLMAGTASAGPKWFRAQAWFRQK